MLSPSMYARFPRNDFWFSCVSAAITRSIYRFTSASFAPGVSVAGIIRSLKIISVSFWCSSRNIGFQFATFNSSDASTPRCAGVNSDFSSAFAAAPCFGEANAGVKAAAAPPIKLARNISRRFIDAPLNPSSREHAPHQHNTPTHTARKSTSPHHKTNRELLPLLPSQLTRQCEQMIATLHPRSLPISHNSTFATDVVGAPHRSPCTHTRQLQQRSVPAFCFHCNFSTVQNKSAAENHSAAPHFHFPVSIFQPSLRPIRRNRGSCHHNLHAPVQLPSRRRVVRRHRLFLAEPVRRNRVRCHAL